MIGHHGLAVLHLAVVLPGFVLETGLLIGRKGTPRHRALGRVYLGLVSATGALTPFMPAVVGPRGLDHFGFLHGLSLITLITVPYAAWAARRHDVVGHAAAMISLYVGGILVAGGFALLPGRLLHQWLWG